MARATVLVIDDEEDIIELVKFNLVRDGYVVEGATSGEIGFQYAVEHRPSLVILDLMLPGMDGLEVCKQLKSNSLTQNIPILVLSARGEEVDVVTGLELGADDYLPKPFSPRILLARVKALIRRSVPKLNSDKEILQFQDLLIHPGRHEVTLSGQRLDLTLTEFKILHLLSRNAGWVFTRAQIVDAVKGDDYPVTERSVDVQIVGIRKKLLHIGKHIETVRGVGYRFRE